MKRSDLRQNVENEDSRRNGAKASISRVVSLTFYRQGERWVDSRLTVKKSSGEERKIVWLSQEYFEFLKANPKAGKILALGSTVTFLWEGKVLRIEAKQDCTH